MWKLIPPQFNCLVMEHGTSSAHVPYFPGEIKMMLMNKYSQHIEELLSQSSSGGNLCQPFLLNLSLIPQKSAHRAFSGMKDEVKKSIQKMKCIGQGRSQAIL